MFMQQRPDTIRKVLETVTSLCEPSDQNDRVQRAYDGLRIRLYTRKMDECKNNPLTAESRELIRVFVAEFRSQLGEPVDNALAFLDSAHIETPQQSTIGIVCGHLRTYAHRMIEKLIKNNAVDTSLQPHSALNASQCESKDSGVLQEKSSLSDILTTMS